MSDHAPESLEALPADGERVDITRFSGPTLIAGGVGAAGIVISEQRSDEQEYPQFWGAGRSILHADAVYYLPNAQVWSAFWQSPDQANGPF